METLKKVRGRARVLVAVALLAALGAGLTFLPPSARAQNASGDYWSNATGTATNGINVVVPAAGHSYVLKDLVVTSGTTGVVTFEDAPHGAGSTGAPTGATTLFTVSVLANTPLELGPGFFSVGFVASTTNTTLVAVQSGATVTCSARYEIQ